MYLYPPLVTYTLIQVAKLNGGGPQTWLTDVLARIADHKITRLRELMPWTLPSARPSIAGPTLIDRRGTPDAFDRHDN
jgi:hypothetical protein